MSLRRLRLGLALAGMAVALPSRGAVEEPSTSTAIALRFVQGLNDRGYSDLALDYVDQLRKAPDTPADLRAVLDYEEGISRLEEAAHVTDSNLRAAQYEEARRRLEAFLKDHPSHPLLAEALKRQARLLVESGHLSVLRGQETKSRSEAESLSAEGRALFRQARDAYARAEAPLKAAYDSMPKSLSEDDPLRLDRDRALLAWIDARLQRALVDYEEAQTYPPGNPLRDSTLDRARAQFEEIAEGHRTQMAGVVARMWQGKCFEERGELGKAMGIYDELMAEPDPRLKPLQRQVDYFRIILMGRRHDYALAADEAQRWLQASPRDRHTDEGLGVLVEYARNTIAQAKALAAEGPREAARPETIRRATDALAEVVRFNSRHKPAAIKLLRQVKAKAAPKGAAEAVGPPPANMKVDDALAQADELMEGEDYDRALSYLRFAARRIDPTKAQEKDREEVAKKLNRVRALMSFALYESKRYDEADILAEHLVRTSPKDEMASKAIQVALASLVASFNEAPEGARAGEVERLSSLSDYTAKAFPDSEESDIARMTLGEIEMNRRHYAEAASLLEGLRESSPKRADALAKAGTAHWFRSQALKDEPDRAKAEVGKAVELLQKAMKLRHDAKLPPTDPDLVNNACDLADILLYQDRPADALALLEPLAKAVADKKPSEEEAPLRSRLISAELRALIGTGKVDKAIEEMRALEAAGGAGQSMAQLYFSLGRLLEKEMDALRAKGEAEKLEKTRATYLKFLDALAGTEKGQTYESLEWAGESMLTLGAPAKAAPVFERVLKTYGKDPKFLADPEGPRKLNRARMKRLVALREAKEFDAAQAELAPLLQVKPKPIDLLMEQGFQNEARAEATGSKGDWDRAATNWQGLATLIQKAPRGSKMPEYYEAWYHTAYCQWKQGQPGQAIKSLKAILILSPTVGSPEMKKKYEDLLRRINR